MTPTEKLIAEARELDRKATPGPWRASEKSDYSEIYDNKSWGKGLSALALVGSGTDDAQFIVRSRTLIPALCDALEQAQATLEQTWEWDMYKAAQKEIERLRKELAALASESVKRDIALAKLEAEVAAAMNRRGEWTRKETNGGTLAICSQCKYPVSYWHKTKYCGECGANMEEVE